MIICRSESELGWKIVLAVSSFHTVGERIACEQAPKWGIGRRQKSSSERGPPNRAQLAQLTEFSFRPNPYLGVCSQAGVRTELSSNIREYSHFKLIGSVVKIDR